MSLRDLLSTQDSKLILTLMFLCPQATRNILNCPWVELYERDAELTLRSIAVIVRNHSLIWNSLPADQHEHYDRMLVAAIMFAQTKTGRHAILGEIEVDWQQELRTIPKWIIRRHEIQEIIANTQPFGLTITN